MSQQTMGTMHDEGSGAFAKPARIVMVIRLLNGRVGGAERLFVDTANLFASVGHDVTCLYCDSKRGRPFYQFTPKVSWLNLHGRLARRGTVYRTLDWVSRHIGTDGAGAPVDWLAKNLYFTRRLHVVLRELQPDLVISFLPPANTPTLLAGRLAGAPVVPTNHNVPAHDYESPVRWDQNPVDKWLRRRTLGLSERIHVLFPSFMEWFPDELRERVVAIPNYVSPEFEDVVMPDSRDKVIVAAGRLAPVKGFDDLVEAWSLIAKDFPDWQVKIYGSGPEEQRLHDQIARLGVSQCVRLMGHERDMKSAYLGAEILAHPALHEGFGLSVAEALSCGLPVVAYADCDGVNEFVRSEYNGILVPRSDGPRGIADALLRLIVDTRLRNALRSATQESVAHFSSQAFLEAWTSILEEVRSKQ